MYHRAVLAYLSRAACLQLLRYRAQSALAVLGVAIGAANITVLISITDLSKHEAGSFISNMGANMLFVAPYIDLENGGFSNLTPAQVSQFMPRAVLTNLESLPEIEALTGVVMLPGHVGYGAKRMFTTLEGVSPAYQRLRHDKLAVGRWLSDEDELQRAEVLVLGDKVRQGLFGAATGVGEELVVKGRRMRVVGSMAPEGHIGLEDIDNRVFMPLGVAQELFGFSGLQAVLLRYRQGVREGQAEAAVKDRLRLLLKPGERLEETYSVWTLKDATQMLDSTLGIFRTVLLGIASIAMVVAGLGIMSVMLMRVLSRRLEIGIRRSVGASTTAIGMQFLAESLVQSLLGGVCGMALGIAGVHAYCAYAHWQPFVSWATVALAAGYSVAVGIVFGAYPAWRAAQLDPIKCLRA